MRRPMLFTPSGRTVPESEPGWRRWHRRLAKIPMSRGRSTAKRDLSFPGQRIGGGTRQAAPANVQSREIRSDWRVLREISRWKKPT